MLKNSQTFNLKMLLIKITGAILVSRAMFGTSGLVPALENIYFKSTIKFLLSLSAFLRNFFLVQDH